MVGLARFKNEEYTLHLALLRLAHLRVFALASFKNEELTLYLACVGLASFKNEEYTLYLACIWARKL